MSRPNDDREFDDPDRTNARLIGALVWIGVAGLGAAVAFTVVRLLVNRRPSDPTTQRIQTLIDEANRLLKTLDEQRHTA
ncbi:MAG: hypothetical protein M3R51_03775 [Candidatus Eremiobacteraeota bacterium]|nr:hypothetical protein [Candidatus Eremiobacteraeota bacterium]